MFTADQKRAYISKESYPGKKNDAFIIDHVYDEIKLSLSRFDVLICDKVFQLKYLKERPAIIQGKYYFNK